MTTLVRSATARDGPDVEGWLAPMHRLVAEEQVARRGAADGTVHVEQTARTGPFSSYRRTVRVRGLDVEERVEFRITGLLLGPLLTFLYRRALRRRPEKRDRLPPWAPALPLDPRSVGVLGAIAVLAIPTGYLGTVLTQMITYAGREFGTDTDQQGVALAVVRADILIALPIAALADRIGRRRVLRVTTTLGPLLMALCALAPNLPLLTAFHLLARPLVTATAIIGAVIVVEEMNAGARAWAASVFVSSAAIGSGLTLVIQPAADLGTRWWRVVFAVPVLCVPVLGRVFAQIPESRRFRRAEAGADPTVRRRRLARARALRPHARRLSLLATGSALLAMGSNPSTQFNNDFLRRERGFSATQIAVFGLVTSIPGALGVLLGGRIADTRGKRVVVSLGLLAGFGTRIAALQSDGVMLWVWSTVGTLVIAVALPALAIYGPELFPTAVRSTASATLTSANRVGGVIGLLTAGYLGRGDNLGDALSLMALAGIAMAVLVLTAYPETAGRELEDLNPADGMPGPAIDDSQSTTAAATSPSRLDRL